MWIGLPRFPSSLVTHCGIACGSVRHQTRRKPQNEVTKPQKNVGSFKWICSRFKFFLFQNLKDKNNFFVRFLIVVSFGRSVPKTADVERRIRVTSFIFEFSRLFFFLKQKKDSQTIISALLCSPSSFSAPSSFPSASEARGRRHFVEEEEENRFLSAGEHSWHTATFYLIVSLFRVWKVSSFSCFSFKWNCPSCGRRPVTSVKSVAGSCDVRNAPGNTDGPWKKEKNVKNKRNEMNWSWPEVVDNM